jgi:hypothetical protein
VDQPKRHTLGITTVLSALCGFVATLACSAVVSAPVFAGDWIADSNSGCRIWNPNPSGKESISWSGACRDGVADGEGVLQWFKDGLPFERNEGQWQVGRQIGHGVQVWPSGRYEGELRDGMPQGHGVLIMGEARYEGEFSDGKPHGVGVLQNPKGVFQGIWKFGCFRSGNQTASIGVDVSSCR